MALPTDFSNIQIAREGPLPGYTGHIPGVKANVMGHSYSDGCKRGVAITNALHNNEFPKAIHLGVEVRPAGQDDFYAQLSCGGEDEDRRAIHWKCSKREPPKETHLASGKVDMHSFKQCIGSTEGPAVMAGECTMSISDLPYKERKLVVKKTHGNRGPEYETVNAGKHHVSGYTGHTHGQQHVYGKTYGNLTRELRKLPAEPSTSDKYLEYEETRPLMPSKLNELGHNVRYNHYELLSPGQGNLGPLPEGAM